MKLNNPSRYVYDITLEEDEQFEFPTYSFDLTKLEFVSPYVYSEPVWEAIKKVLETYQPTKTTNLVILAGDDFYEDNMAPLVAKYRFFKKRIYCYDNSEAKPYFDENIGKKVFSRSLIPAQMLKYFGVKY